ncbi:hypothetical protein Pla108_25490 [Botrimarina colliarenosi]|uniref:Uncharacterized protein n=1 Tax=Botrimarina colliarenosi TaxID=2528001 RepID=A0A5C6ACA1_9BACT|nr:hypothetical protein [Botrimarina colliarenosi]TWT96775.1 hypothetical protein Pla108_25490 [Botrimarina colliarenosi]
MSLGWNASGDFGVVVDTLETVVLRRGGAGGAKESKQAWRFQCQALSETPLTGAVRVLDATWQLPVEGGVVAPSPGDSLVDSEKACWVVRTVSKLRGGTRYACGTRRVEIAAGCAERFDLERPVIETTSEGPVIVDWRVVRASCIGHFGRGDTLDSQEVVRSPSRLTVTVVEPLELRSGDRLRRHRGGLYSVLQQDYPGTLGDPFQFDVEAVA